jgi:hypothetical protein
MIRFKLYLRGAGLRLDFASRIAAGLQKTS